MRRLLAEVWRRPGGAFGLIVLVLVVAGALVSLMWTPHPLLDADTANRLAHPSWSHPLGTDTVGRDMASWLLAGTRTTLAVSIGATVLAGVVGVVLAAASALLPTGWSEPLVVLIDILVALPVMLLAMLLAAPFGGSLVVVVLAVGFGAGVSTARVLRPAIIAVSRSDYLLASRATGTGDLARIVEHILPNVSPAIVVQLSNTAAVAILSEVGLTFLGYGASPATPSWGRVLSNAQAFIGVAPLSVVWPGLTIAITVLALAQFGDALRDALDPALRRGTVIVTEPEGVAA